MGMEVPNSSLIKSRFLWLAPRHPRVGEWSAVHDVDRLRLEIRAGDSAAARAEATRRAREGAISGVRTTTRASDRHMQEVANAAHLLRLPEMVEV